MKNLIDKIFSLETAGILILVGFGILIVSVAMHSREESAACYKQGMIKVRTDGGTYCANPTMLVEVK